MVRRKLSEHDLDVTVLYILNLQGDMSTTELKANVIQMLNPEGRNLDSLVNRNDTKIEQIIRNIVSHRDVPGNIVYEGFVNYNWRNGLLSITDNGRLYLDSVLVREIVDLLE